MALKMPKWLESMPPAKRQKTVLVIVVSSFMLLMTIIVFVTDDGRLRGQPETKDDEVGNVLLRENPRDIGLSGVANDVDDLAAKVDKLEQENKALREMVEDKPDDPRNPSATLMELSEQVGRERESLGAPPGTTYNPARPRLDPAVPPGTSFVRPNEQSNQRPAPVAPAVAPKIITITQEDPEPSIATDIDIPPVYLPTGSMITGTLLNGLDAPTGRAAQNAPIPVVIRVKLEAILPSRYKSDVREAFILASGYGDLSSERAYLRAERLSMILTNGDVIDIPIKMSAVGSDAKAGLRGRVVSKQGAIIAKALLAGTADGISRAFSNSFQIGRGSGDDQPSASDIGMAGLSGGTSTALDRVAAYFLAQAEAMYPIIEIDGGREVTMVLLEGVELAPRSDLVAQEDG